MLRLEFAPVRDPPEALEFSEATLARRTNSARLIFRPLLALAILACPASARRQHRDRAEGGRDWSQ
jgi:hypothetical protein